MTEDHQRLRDYAEKGSEAAFGEIVVQHLGLVYSAALRRVGGDVHLAQDVAQTVFTLLARKAWMLPKDVVLGAWLYRQMCRVSAQTVRTEQRRRVREYEAVHMNASNAGSEPAWDEVAPFLEEVMETLGARDREAIVLRYFERRDLRGVGAALGISEEAAKKRVSRAVEKLRAGFKRKGLALSATGVGALITGHAITAAPAGLAAVITNSALASAALGLGLDYFISKFIATLPAKTEMATVTVIAIVIGVLVTTVIQQRQAMANLHGENLTLQQQTQELGRLTEEVERLRKVQVDADELARLRLQHTELLQLRGEVNQLRGTTGELAASVAAKENAEKFGIRVLGLLAVFGEPPRAWIAMKQIVGPDMQGWMPLGGKNLGIELVRMDAATHSVELRQGNRPEVIRLELNHTAERGRPLAAMQAGEVDFIFSGLPREAAVEAYSGLTKRVVLQRGRSPSFEITLDSGRTLSFAEAEQKLATVFAEQGEAFVTHQDKFVLVVAVRERERFSQPGTAQSLSPQSGGDPTEFSTIRLKSMPVNQICDIFARTAGRTSAGIQQWPIPSLSLQIITPFNRAETFYTFTALLALNDVAVENIGDHEMRFTFPNRQAWEAFQGISK